MAISTLSILSENGYDISPNEIRQSLLEYYNWKPVSAKTVEDVAESMSSGVRSGG